MPVTNCYTYGLNPEQAAALESHMRAKGFVFREVPYAAFAGDQEKLSIVFYQSGKLVVQGKRAAEFVDFVLEPEILKEAKRGYETILNPDLLLPRLGIDESGKGDFFGPLCVAGVYVNAALVERFQEAGIRDSKKISSDRRILDLARMIRETPACVHSVVTIGNESYNRLYEKMASVNRILAWGHARVIENLMTQKSRMNPVPVRAISDQFASGKETVANALMGLGRTIELIQRHRAEEDIAVAAASILARDAFVTKLVLMGKEFQMIFPKGASVAVENAGREFLGKFGPGSLHKVAKMHFRTAFRIQGLAEPPRFQWKKKEEE